MAITLLGASNASVTFPSLIVSYPAPGPVAWTVAITLTTGGTLTTDRRVVGQWELGGIFSPFQCWVMNVLDTDEIGFAVHTSGGLTYFGRKTTDSPLAMTSTHRIVATWTIGSPNVIAIWVNGVSRALTTWIGNTDLASMRTAATTLLLGHEPSEPIDGEDGAYAEVALWDAVVPDWFARGYGIGLSPTASRPNGLLYARLLQTGALIDQWSGTAGTNTAGTTEAHPSMMIPTGGQ